MSNLTLDTNGKIVAVLMHINGFQTDQEIMVGNTVEDNGAGWNGCDSNICQSMARFYQDRGYLSVKQISFLKRALPKYHRQVPSNIKELPFRTFNNAPANTANTSGKDAVADGNQIKITTSYANRHMIAKVKTLSGRRWNQDGKFWSAPKKLKNVQKLADWGFTLDQELKDFLASLTVAKVTGDTLNIPGLKMELYPYQKDGVAFIENNEGRTLLGDEMGLGKTPQALAWLQLHPEARPAIIVVPASLKLNWAREAKNWMSDPKVQILSGSPKAGDAITGEIVIINYDILTKWLTKLQAINPQTIILDECHYIKSHTAQRTRAIKGYYKESIIEGKKVKKWITGLIHRVPHVIALSGTPIVNRPVEMWNTINIIDKNLFISAREFKMRYCGPTANKFATSGYSFDGASNTQELNQILLESIMVRRLKKDVLKDLPLKARAVVPMQIVNREEYNTAQNDFVEYLRGFDSEKAERASRAEQLAKIEGLKQLAMEGKIDASVEWVKNFLESDEKLVVFFTHTKPIRYFQKVFGDMAVTVDGSVSQTARQERVDRFQEDDTCKLFLGNVKAAGVGLTLTEASNVCFVEFPWSPGDTTQAEDRVHRIGQVAESVNAWYLIANDTIDEEVVELLNSKQKVLDQVLDGAEVDATSIMGELLQRLRS